MNTAHLVTAALALALALAVSAAVARADPAPPGRAPVIDLQLKQADVTNVYRLLGDVGRVPVDVDACLAGRTVDVTFKNAPLETVFAALDAKLATTRAIQGARVVIRCKLEEQVEGDPRLERRVDLDLHKAPIASALALLAAAGGVTLELPEGLAGTIDVEAHNIRLGTALEIVEQAGAGCRAALLSKTLRVTRVAAVAGAE